MPVMTIIPTKHLGSQSRKAAVNETSLGYREFIGPPGLESNNLAKEGSGKSQILGIIKYKTRETEAEGSSPIQDKLE